MCTYTVFPNLFQIADHKNEDFFPLKQHNDIADHFRSDLANKITHCMFWTQNKIQINHFSYQKWSTNLSLENALLMRPQKYLTSQKCEFMEI